MAKSMRKSQYKKSTKHSRKSPKRGRKSHKKHSVKNLKRGHKHSKKIALRRRKSRGMIRHGGHCGCGVMKAHRARAIPNKTSSNKKCLNAS